MEQEKRPTETEAGHSNSDGQAGALARQLLAGAVSGLVATIPMTMAMLVLHRLLPRYERFKLPPLQITDVLLHRTVGKATVNTATNRAVAFAMHFGYGTGVGAIFGPVAVRVSVSSMVSGVLYAMLVWAGSYLGWIPAASILPPATRHPARHNAIMILAHVIYGAALGMMFGRVRPASGSGG